MRAMLLQVAFMLMIFTITVPITCRVGTLEGELK